MKRQARHLLIFGGGNVHIRPAVIEDSESLARIQVDSYRTAYAGILPQAALDHFTYEEQEQDWRDLLAVELEDLLCAAETDAQEIVGYALGSPGRSDIPPYDGELTALHVRRTFQRRGIGRQLLAAIAAQLAGRGCTSLMLWVLKPNPARTFLYERLGGQMIGERDWDGNGEFGVHVQEVAYGWPDIKELYA
jgi:ribosomal protein S18 acetylase RimI-like enzyme